MAQPSARNLVLAVDTDPAAGKRALDWLASVCRPADTLHIVHVATVMSPHIESATGFVGTSYEVQQGSLDQAKRGVDAAREFVNRLKAAGDAAHLHSQVHLFADESTAPAQALAESIAKVATECHAALVVMARSIKSPMTRLLSGSVTEDVQHRLHCPLVLVP